MRWRRSSPLSRSSPGANEAPHAASSGIMGPTGGIGHLVIPWYSWKSNSPSNEMDDIKHCQAKNTHMNRGRPSPSISSTFAVAQTWESQGAVASSEDIASGSWPKKSNILWIGWNLINWHQWRPFVQLHVVNRCPCDHEFPDSTLWNINCRSNSAPNYCTARKHPRPRKCESPLELAKERPCLAVFCQNMPIGCYSVAKLGLNTATKHVVIRPHATLWNSAFRCFSD